MELLPEVVRVEASRRLLELGMPLPITHTSSSSTTKTAAHRGAAALRRRMAATGPSARLPGTPLGNSSGKKRGEKEKQRKLKDVKCCEARLVNRGSRGGQLVDDVPLVIVRLVQWLNGHVDDEGIFRRSGSLARQRKVRERLWECMEIEELNLQVHDVANVLKQTLREALEPIIPTDFQNKLLLTLKDAKIEDTDSLFLYLCLLPPRHASSLVYLTHFLALVADHSEMNRMDVSNLAIVFAPILFTECSGSTNRSELQNCKELVQILIENFDKVCDLPVRINELGLPEFELGHSSSESDLLLKPAPSQRKRKHVKAKQRRRSGSLSRVLNATVRGIQKAKASFLTAQSDNGHPEGLSHSLVVDSDSENGKVPKRQGRSKTDLTCEDLNWLRRSEALVSVRGRRRQTPQKQQQSDNSLVKHKEVKVMLKDSKTWDIRTPELDVEVSRDFLKSVDLKTPDSKKMRSLTPNMTSNTENSIPSRRMPKKSQSKEQPRADNVCNDENSNRTLGTTSKPCSSTSANVDDILKAVSNCGTFSTTNQSSSGGHSSRSSTDLSTRLSAWQEAREARREARVGKSVANLQYLLRDVPRRVHSVRAVKQTGKASTNKIKSTADLHQSEMDPDYGRVRRQSSAFELMANKEKDLGIRPSRRSMGITSSMPTEEYDEHLMDNVSSFPSSDQVDMSTINEEWKSAEDFFRTPAMDLLLKTDAPNSRRSSVQKLLKENKGQVLKSVETFSKFGNVQSKKY